MWNWKHALFGAALAGAVVPAADAARTAPRVIEMKVTADGFEPAEVEVKRGQPVELRITRVVDATCAKDIVIPGAKVKAALPLNETVTVKFTPKKSGQLTYGCAMDQMVGGVLVVQ
jgi:plastocyanin domain-containing protein